MDTVFIDELRLETLIGVYPREKAVPQPIEISLAIGIAETAARSGHLTDTVDYAAVVARIREDLAAQHFGLVERLADHVAHMVLDEFAAQWVRVTVAKPGMIRGVKRVGVTLERSRG